MITGYRKLQLLITCENFVLFALLVADYQVLDIFWKIWEKKKVYNLGVSGMVGRVTVNTAIFFFFFSPYVTDCMLGE